MGSPSARQGPISCSQVPRRQGQDVPISEDQWFSQWVSWAAAYVGGLWDRHCYLSTVCAAHFLGGWGKPALAPNFPEGHYRPELGGGGGGEVFVAGIGTLTSLQQRPVVGLLPVFPPGPSPFPTRSSTPSFPGFLGPLSLCLSSHRFQGCPSLACLSFGGPSGCFDSIMF